MGLRGDSHVKATEGRTEEDRKSFSLLRGGVYRGFYLLGEAKKADMVLLIWIYIV